jgi:FMN reductase
MSVLLIAGSPSERSRSAALLDRVGRLLAAGRGTLIDRLSVRDLPPQALMQADFGHPAVQDATRRVAEAQAIVVATPVYKAAYSGVLKLLLDLLPQTAFKGKVVLPLATGGSPHHMLALDYALRPVLQSLAARHILPGVYATDAQVALTPEDAYVIHPDIDARLGEAAATLYVEGLRTASAHPGKAGFEEPIAFADVRCSV